MKSLIFIISIISILFFSSCKDNNPTEPSFSISQEINDARPISSIFIYRDSGNLRFGKDPSTDTPFKDAYAENGYFIVISNVSNYYFNLSLAKQVYIYENNISIYY